MKAIHKLFIDDRLKYLCSYCGEFPDTRDHVPSKALLDESFPPDLPTVAACNRCNNDFSLDEEYVACFIDCVIKGSTSLDSAVSEKTKRAFRRSPQLQRMIEESKIVGNDTINWRIDELRFQNVLLKLARGHAVYENAEQQLGEPVFVNYCPLALLTRDEVEIFESVEGNLILPELGSRKFIRMIESAYDGWMNVQPGVYRYLVSHVGFGLSVRIVLREYLACEVVWS